MPRLLLLVFSFLCALTAFAQGAYRSLDPAHPILFSGKQVTYAGDTITLGPRAFFIDGQLSDAEAARQPYVFNSVNKAAAQLSADSEAEPMVLYIAPWVYWLDNPDDTVTRRPHRGNTPYALEIDCPWLRFQGLNPDAANVVLACNRGQTIGAVGNFTMLRISGDGTRSENITFGNYCNVDLQFPLKPELNRPQRAQAIVQAQLIHCNGDKVLARNTRFISRLNLCPFTGAKRVLFDSCHFESTDDALCGTGVYLHSTFDIYSSKPFYNTTGTGAVFLGCALRSFAGPHQYLTKAGGPVAVIDSRFASETNTYWGWQEVVPHTLRNYQWGVQYGGKPLLIGAQNPQATVDLEGHTALDGYRFVANGKPVYNTYNLLRGNDNWDPMGIKSTVEQTERATGKKLSSLPVQLVLTQSRDTIETGKNETLLVAKAFRFGNYPGTAGPPQWTVAPAHRQLVRLEPSADGLGCRVAPTNERDSAVQVVIQATAASGLEAAALVTVLPQILEAPLFKKAPRFVFRNGQLALDYTLATPFRDQSDIKWYRCRDAQGANPIEVAVSRDKLPLRTYTFTAGDEGWWLMARISPRHIRSEAGAAVMVVAPRPVKATDILAPRNLLVTDFAQLSTRNQPRVLPGFWTLGHVAPQYRENQYPADTTRDAWYFGAGSEGAGGMQGLLQGREGVLYYTPLGMPSGNMELELELVPFKTAGQGFSVAHRYMDVLVQWDGTTRSGYGLRLIRTTRHSDAVDAVLVQYANGTATPFGAALSTSAFRGTCTLRVAVSGDQLLAELTTKAAAPDKTKPGVLPEVRLQGRIKPLAGRGLGIGYHGGSPTMVRRIRAEWKNLQGL
ncbi:hypothetical protein SAMN05444008_101336 [Cnuella takakiae]|uniref:Pectinesterase n=1 Tax=Cnuella takakiae TaxID=1302690 RepID=A0A1M4T4S8_9BACT|nr:hypothetical protein [Cnuella takakiae]OLY90677.1 hypothetical protein BUE76_01255 [Cnuella takakiae]SHE39385.1 hypothetical protein SAMN05444008_101336 [Cnuella takakiae]